MFKNRVRKTKGKALGSSYRLNGYRCGSEHAKGGTKNCISELHSLSLLSLDSNMSQIFSRSKGKPTVQWGHISTIIKYHANSSFLKLPGSERHFSCQNFSSWQQKTGQIFDKVQQNPSSTQTLKYMWHRFNNNVTKLLSKFGVWSVAIFLFCAVWKYIFPLYIFPFSNTDTLGWGWVNDQLSYAWHTVAAEKFIG